MGYEARKFGVSRRLRGNEAKQKCPEIKLVYVPERRGKADLSRYRQAGAEVIQILAQFSDHIERASIDEAYLDITKCVHRRIQQMGFKEVEASMLPHTHVAGFSLIEGSPVDSDSKILEDRVTEWEDNADGGESVSSGALSVEGGSDMFEETDVEMLDEEEEEEEEDAADGVTSTVQGTVETESEGGGSGNCREQLLAEWLKGGGDLSLAVGALVAMEMRQAVLEGAGFTCSAGIAHNKARPPTPLSPTSPPSVSRLSCTLICNLLQPTLDLLLENLHLTYSLCLLMRPHRL